MSEPGSERTRTYSWHDPLTLVKDAQGRSGLEVMRAIVDGTFPKPPIADTLDYELVEVGEGLAVFEVTPKEFHYNPIGLVHGGLAATLLDSAMGCAIHTTLPASAVYSTIELKVNYIRALTLTTGKVRAEGRVIHVGGRTGVAEARLTGADGKLYAHGTTTCLIIRG
jgi:uncharacterized protein (TIGR00369 family)